jgi:hypothetical protein
MTIEMIEPTLDQLIAPFGMDCVHIPTDMDSKTEDGWGPFLEWGVHVFYKQKLVVAMPYRAGIAHIPGYAEYFKGRQAKTDEDFRRLNKILKSGKGDLCQPHNQMEIRPELKEVLYSLVSDGDAVNYGDFESWAENYGYDTDSRRAENIYKKCLLIGRALVSALGTEGYEQLCTAYQDY